MDRCARRALFGLALSLLTTPAFRPVTGLTAPESRSAARAACIFDRATLHTASGSCRPRARAYPPNMVGRVQRSIYDSSLTFGIPYIVLYKIAMCESSLNPHAAHAGHYGLYQFLPATFYRAISGLKQQTGVSAHTYWSPLDSAYAAGYLFATGESRSWSCEKLAVQGSPIG